MQPKPEEERRKWHVSKEVPLALIVSLIFQTSGIVWWVAKADARIDNHTQRIERIEAAEASRSKAEQQSNAILTQILERLVRIETRLDYQPANEGKRGK